MQWKFFIKEGCKLRMVIHPYKIKIKMSIFFSQTETKKVLRNIWGYLVCEKKVFKIYSELQKKV